MAQHLKALHFHASTHCSLCRRRLPEPDYDMDKDPLEDEAWEYEVLGFCEIIFSGENPRILTTQADFRNPKTFTTSVPTDHGRSLVDFCLEPECRQCEEEKIAHLVHIPCWKLINSSEKHDSTSIYEFAQSRYPLFISRDAFHNECDTLMGVTATIVERDDLLKLFASLPPEIRSIIAANCLSLHTVSRISSADITKCRSSQYHINYDYRTASDSLGITQNLILGQKYISSIEFHQSKGILVRKADFEGLWFTLGLYGLQALSILYNDGSTSEWLGNHTNGWSGIMLTKNFPKLQILHDSLKYLRVDLEDTEVGCEVPRVLWDKVLPFSRTQRYYILDTTPRVSQVRNFPGWRLCKYLPFVEESSTISGLTMYLNGHGVTGIATHGKIGRQIGHCQGCVIHFFLQQNERIVSVWLRMPAQHIMIEKEPCVLVITNFSRSCLFGPTLPGPVMIGNQYAWTPLIQNSNIVGIFCDALAIARCGRITNFGISHDPAQDYKSMTNDLPSIPSPFHRPNIRQDTSTGHFFSNCKLDQVKKLQVCQKGTRSIGMAVHRLDGRIDVLGQWDYVNSILSDVYSEHDGSLSSITFRLGKGASCFYVDGIFVSIDQEEPPEITVTEHSKLISLALPDQTSVAWWFSRNYDDVQLWEPTYRDLSVSRESYHIKELV